MTPETNLKMHIWYNTDSKKKKNIYIYIYNTNSVIAMGHSTCGPWDNSTMTNLKANETTYEWVPNEMKRR